MEKTEKQWEAECDFRVLTDAESIKADKKRFSSALSAGKKVVKQKDKEVSAMKKVAKKKPVQRKASKPKSKTYSKRKK